VVAPVPWQERDLAPGYLADENGLTWVTERGLDLHRVVVGEELVETRTPDDRDIGSRSHAGQATFAPAEPGEEPAEDEPGADVFSPPLFPDDDGEGEESEDPPDDESEDPPDGAEEEDEEEAGADVDDEPFLLSVR